MVGSYVYKIVEVNDNTRDEEVKDILDFLYNDWSMTIEGLSEDSIGDYVNWTAENCDGFNTGEIMVYAISGSVMNDYYGLTGSNAYPNDLTLVAIPLKYMNNVNRIAIPRMSVGCRWFTDIVDNNASRENR